MLMGVLFGQNPSLVNSTPSVLTVCAKIWMIAKMFVPLTLRPVWTQRISVFAIWEETAAPFGHP
jgi:hypothetical protein